VLIADLLKKSIGLKRAGAEDNMLGKWEGSFWVCSAYEKKQSNRKLVSSQVSLLGRTYSEKFGVCRLCCLLLTSFMFPQGKKSLYNQVVSFINNICDYDFHP
jgi:hypothetical protein